MPYNGSFVKILVLKINTLTIQSKQKILIKIQKAVITFMSHQNSFHY